MPAYLRRSTLVSSNSPGPVPPLGASPDGPPAAPAYPDAGVPAPTYPAAAYPGQSYPGEPYPGPGAGAPAPKKGFAVTALVLGIVAVVLCLVPIINNLSFVLALVALVFGVLALVGISKGKQTGKGMAITSLVLAVVAIVGVIASQAFYTSVLDEVADAIDETQVVEEQPVDDAAAADDAVADDAAADPAGDAAAAAGSTIGFDQPFLYEDGLEVTVGAPQPYEPSEWAAGTEGGTSYVVMTVTIVNGSAENFDPAIFYVTASSAGTEATQIYDTDGLGSTPSTAVLPGGSVSFPIAFALNDPAQIVLEVEPSMFTYESFIVTNG
jgi:hypothetical protein